MFPHSLWLKYTDLDLGVNAVDILDDVRENTRVHNNSIALDWIAAVISLAVNIMATLLILYQAW